MKQRKPLQRRTGLRATTSLPRPTESMRGRAPVKPRRAGEPAESTLERIARKLVRERSGGLCEMCGALPATNFQHRQNRSQGGQWTSANGLDVCGSGTTGCHGRIHANPATAMRKGWTVSREHDPVEVPVFLRRFGLVLLDNEGGYRTLDDNEIGEVA